MKLDPTKMKDWEVAEAAEENMKPFVQLAKDTGLEDDELIPLPLGQLVGTGDDAGAVNLGVGLRVAPVQILPDVLGQRLDQARHLAQGRGIYLVDLYLQRVIVQRLVGADEIKL